MNGGLVLGGVGVVLDGARIVDGVSLQVEAGQWLGLIGPNGAGKSTLLRAAAGLVAATGSISVDGCEPRHASRRELARHVAFVPQDPHMPAGMTVTEYVLLGRTAHLSYLGVERARDHEVVRSVLRALDLEPLARRMLAALSGGERQRAVLGRALAQDARVLLLDEPTTALDVGHQQQVLELVDELRRERGLTVVTALHDLTLAGQYADRLALISGGRIAAVGDPASVLTERLLGEHWGARVRVMVGDDGSIVVLPVRPRTRARADA